MLLPSIFGNDLFDGFFNFPFPEERNGRRTENRIFGPQGHNLMKTDVQENDQAFIVEIDLPGFKKEDVKVALEDGYLNVSASREDKQEEKKESRYIRKERYVGACQRNFYVGDEVEEGDIKAEFSDGVLKLVIAKKEEKPKVEERKYISIE